MCIKIGSASIDENGCARGGLVGDQTGKEIRIQSFYDFPWTAYIECLDKAMAEKAASYMEQICLDDHFGYDQSQRTTGYEAIVANGGRVKGAKGEFDCSSLVSSCYRLSGLNISVTNTTFTLLKELMRTGFKIYTDDDHIHNDKFAMRGGIYLNQQHHVVMALENGISVGAYTIITLQTDLNKLGYGLVVDGVSGPKTITAIKHFQANNYLTPDGIVGQLTRTVISNTITKMGNR